MKAIIPMVNPACLVNRAVFSPSVPINLPQNRFGWSLMLKPGIFPMIARCIIKHTSLAGMFFLFYSVPTLLEDPVPAGFGLSIVNAGLIMLPAAIVSMAFAPL